MPIATPRLDLVPLDARMREAIRDGRGEGRAWAQGYPTPGDVEVAGLAAAPEPWTQYAIVERSSGSTIGGVGFHRGPSDGEVEIGYGIAPAARGRGYATEAVLALVDVARRQGLHAVVAETDDGNLPSERVLERSGFARVRHVDGITQWKRALDGAPPPARPPARPPA